MEPMLVLSTPSTELHCPGRAQTGIEATSARARMRRTLRIFIMVSIPGAAAEGGAPNTSLIYCACWPPSPPGASISGEENIPL
jgi:hypothetical protein